MTQYIVMWTGMGPVVLLGGVSLMLAGTSMLLYGALLVRQGLARRVSLVRPKEHRSARPLLEASAVRETLLLSGPLSTLPEREQREIVRFAARLSVSPAHASTTFLLLRSACAVLFGLAAYLIGARFPLFAASPLLTMVLAAACAFAGWLSPSFAIRRAARSRAKAAMAGLADALELIVICVEVGLALEDAIDRTVEELKHSHPVLAEELAMTSADLKLLPSQDMALERLANRLDEPTVRSVVTTLSQTMRFGTPLAQALRVVASGLRHDNLVRMEEKANRLPTLLTLPMLLFIMPTIFLVVGGPAVLRIIDIFFK
jgi:tight adherence protein C